MDTKELENNIDTFYFRLLKDFVINTFNGNSMCDYTDIIYDRNECGKCRYNWRECKGDFHYCNNGEGEFVDVIY